MIKAITIQNFKSITSASLDLGHINVFIGANGSGKSNILEAIGMVASERSSQIEINAMMQKGVRIAKPNLMVSSFYGQASNGAIEVKISGTDGEWMEYNVSNPTPEDIYSTWVATCGIRGRKGADADRMEKGKKELRDYLSKYLIYSLSVDALRGFTANSMQYPLGINGEGLDVLLNNLPKEEIIQIKEAAKEYIDWIEDMDINWEEVNRTFISGISSCKRKTICFLQKTPMKVHWSYCFSLPCLSVKKLLIFLPLTILRRGLIRAYAGS